MIHVERDQGLKRPHALNPTNAQRSEIFKTENGD